MAQSLEAWLTNGFDYRDFWGYAPAQTNDILRAASKRRKSDLELDMFKVYQDALLGKMDPKHFPSKFTDLWTEARTETNMSEAQMASNFKAWITQADGANKDKKK